MNGIGIKGTLRRERRVRLRRDGTPARSIRQFQNRNFPEMRVGGEKRGPVADGGRGNPDVVGGQGLSAPLNLMDLIGKPTNTESFIVKNPILM